MLTGTQLALILTTLTVFVVYWMNGQRQGRNLPPGPKKYPLIGSLLSMPSTHEWETFAKWGREYSLLWIEALILRSVVSNALCRFWYYSCQRFRDIDYYLKLLQSCHRPSRPKIHYLLQQVSTRLGYLFPEEFTEVFLYFNKTTFHHARRIVSYLYHHDTLKGNLKLKWS